MKQGIKRFFFILGILSLAGCGHPSADMMFNTSTEAYPVVSDSGSTALSSLGGSASSVAVTSVVKIEMQGIAEAKMQSVWPDALILQTKEGNLRFVQLAKCYVQPHNSSSQQPILVGQAKAEDVSADGHSLKFHVDSSSDLAGILKGPFTIAVEIDGDVPSEKTSVFADLTFKARVTL